MENIEVERIATAIGQSWVDELVRKLELAEREVAGAWPGTLSEARMRVRMTLRSRLDESLVDHLAHVANVAARRGWDAVCVADPESAA